MYEERLAMPKAGEAGARRSVVAPLVAAGLLLAGCASSPSAPAAGSAPDVTSTPVPAPVSSSAAPSTEAPSTASSAVSPTVASTPSAAAAASSTAGTAAPGAVRHVFPATGRPASYGPTHHDYPATDIFAACGSTAVSPVDGEIVHWRPDDPYDPATDNPALRGGRSAAILGDDGVRYYLSHFESIEPGLGVGTRVDAGQTLGTVGRSGNAASVDCHIHFGLSPNCPAREWTVRRGVIWPAPYLDDWRVARNTSPAPEIAAWAAAHPDACAEAAADPTAADAG